MTVDFRRGAMDYHFLPGKKERGNEEREVIGVVCRSFSGASYTLYATTN